MYWLGVKEEAANFPGNQATDGLLVINYTCIHVAAGGRCYLRTGIAERDNHIHGKARRVYLMECAGMRVGDLGSNSGSATYWLCDFETFSLNLTCLLYKGSIMVNVAKTVAVHQNPFLFSL